MSVKATINELLVRFGFIRPDVPVQDAAGTPPKPSKTSQSLQAHDKQYHPNGWKPGDKCRLRDSIFNVDDLTSASSTSTQQGQAGQQRQQTQPNNQDFPTESEFEAVIELVKDNPRLVPPALKQALDDLPKKIFDLAENQEYLDDAIADLPDGDAKNSLLADQHDLEKERLKLRGEFLQTYRVLSSILGTAKPTVLKRNPSLPHDASAFPTKLDSVPVVNQDGSVDISFDGASYHFTPCQNGSTGPVEGTINVNGQPKKFILKISNKPGIKHAVPAEALKNEQAASEMLRKAGVNAPDSMVFEKNGEVYKLAEFIDNATPISQATITDDIRNQIKAAYPLLDLMYSTDLLKDDNVRVDQNGKVWFVDNGSAFAFKGYGDKKTTANKRWKGFDFEQRNDAGGAPLPGNDGKGGTAMYPSHYGALYESQKKIQAILGQMTTKDLLKEASRYNMTALVAGLPKESKCQALEEFAASLDKLSAKAAGTRKLKSSLKPQKVQSAQAQAGQQQSQQVAQAQQNVAIPQHIKAMPQDVANALSAGGINLSHMSEIANDRTYPDHWYMDNYPNAQGISSAIGASLPAGYSVGWYTDQGNQGLVVCATANKPKMAGVGSWPSGGFQGWTDGTATTQPSQGTAAQQQQQQAQGATAQSQSAQLPPMTLTSQTIPPAIGSLLNNLGLQGAPYSVWNNNYSHQMFDIALPGQASNTSALQSLANQLPQGMSVTTHSNGNAYIINTSDYYNYWGAYNHNLVQPTTSTSTSSASGQGAATSQTSSSSASTGTSTSGTSTTSSGPNNLISANSIPPSVTSALSGLGLPSLNGSNVYTTPTGVSYISGGNFVTKGNEQQIANALPQGYDLFYSNQGAYVIGNAGDTKYWGGFGYNPILRTAGGAASAQASSTASQPTTGTTTSGAAQQSAQSTNQTAPISSGSTFPSSLNSLISQYKVAATSASNGNQNFVVLGSHTPQQTLQAMAGQLPQGMTIITKANAAPKIVNTSDLGFWTKSYGGTPITAPNAATSASTPASNQASTPSQQQTASKPAPASTSSGSGSSTASSGGTKTYSYGSSGSLVKSGGFNDGNVAIDISNLISSSNLMSAKGKTLLAPGTKLKTQGSLANNGDLYIGLPAGTQQSDLQSIAAQLTNEYQQYGYRAYPMGGSWISVEPIKGTASKPAQTTASTPTAPTPPSNPASAATATPTTTPASTPAPASTTSTAAAPTTPPPSSVPVASTPSQPASTTPTASTPVSTPAAAVQPAQSITSNPAASTTPRRTLSQMLQQRMATANPNLKAAFQAAYNRANGNSGIAQTPTSTATASQQPQTASQTSGQPTTPSGQQAQQTASAPLLTAPKSGNTPTPAQQKVINRFKSQIAANPPPAVVKALQAALSRYYSSI